MNKIMYSRPCMHSTQHITLEICQLTWSLQISRPSNWPPWATKPWGGSLSATTSAPETNQAPKKGCGVVAAAVKRNNTEKLLSKPTCWKKKKGAPWIKIQAVLVAFLLFDLTWSPAWYLGHTTGYTSKSVVSSRHHQCVTCDMHCDMHVIAIHGNLPGCWPPPANHDAYWETSPLTFTDWNSSFYIYLNTYP